MKEFIVSTVADFECMMSRSPTADGRRNSGEKGEVGGSLHGGRDGGGSGKVTEDDARRLEDESRDDEGPCQVCGHPCIESFTVQARAYRNFVGVCRPTTHDLGGTLSGQFG